MTRLFLYLFQLLKYKGRTTIVFTKHLYILLLSLEDRVDALKEYERDSNGSRLSDVQSAHFINSKVRDEKGNLLS